MTIRKNMKMTRCQEKHKKKHQDDNEEGHQGDHQKNHQEHQETNKKSTRRIKQIYLIFRLFVSWWRFMHGGEELGV